MAIPATALAPPAWENLRSELVRFVRARVGDETTADDIVHDVLLRALGELEGPRPPVHLRGWLYRVTRNAIVDHFRSRRPTEELPAEIAADPEDLDSPAGLGLAGCLEPLLGSLPAPYRQALAQSEVEGLPQREIARREGLSLSGAKSRVQRARKMLRDVLLDCCRVEVDRRGGVVEFEKRPDGVPCADASGSRPGTSASCDCRTSRRRA